MRGSDTARARWRHTHPSSGAGDGAVVVRLRLGCGCEIPNRVPLASKGGEKLYPCPNGHGLRAAKRIAE